MRGKGNTNNLAQQILNIEQIDGNITPSSSMLDSSSCIEKEYNESEIDQDQSEHEKCAESENEDKETENEETDDNQSEDKETENDQSKDKDFDTLLEDERVTDKTIQYQLSLKLKHPKGYDSRFNCVRKYYSDIMLLELLRAKTRRSERKEIIKKWEDLVKSKWEDYYLFKPIWESPTQEIIEMEDRIDAFVNHVKQRNQSGKITK